MRLTALLRILQKSHKMTMDFCRSHKGFCRSHRVVEVFYGEVTPSQPTVTNCDSSHSRTYCAYWSDHPLRLCFASWLIGSLALFYCNIRSGGTIHSVTGSCFTIARQRFKYSTVHLVTSLLRSCCVSLSPCTSHILTLGSEL